MRQIYGSSLFTLRQAVSIGWQSSNSSSIPCYHYVFICMALRFCWLLRFDEICLFCCFFTWKNYRSDHCGWSHWKKEMSVRPLLGRGGGATLILRIFFHFFHSLFQYCEMNRDYIKEIAWQNTWNIETKIESWFEEMPFKCIVEQHTKNISPNLHIDSVHRPFSMI